MTAEALEIVSDPSAPQGGHALIRLRGLWVMPGSPSYIIEPLDEEALRVEGDGWPSGEHRPLATRIGAEGVEFSIGPEIVDAPALIPGTPVVVKIPNADLRTELRWPNLPLSPSPRRASMVMTPEQRREAAATAAASREIARMRLQARTDERVIDGIAPHAEPSAGRAPTLDQKPEAPIGEIARRFAPVEAEETRSE